MKEVAQESRYNADPYTVSIGADRISQVLAARYGERYVAYRQEWRRGENCEPLEFPVNVVFDLIDNCNLACPQCLRSVDLIGEYEGFLGTRNRLGLEAIVATLDEGRTYGLPSVNIGGGGECTLHPNFIEICGAILEREVMELRVISNGVNLDESLAKALIELQLPMLSISIDAFSPETYGKVRGKAVRYAQVVENVRRFLDIRNRRGSTFPLLRVTFVAQPANRHEAAEFREHWSALADMVEVQSFHDFRATEFDSDFSCTEPWRRMMIWADGRVGPCCGFPGVVYTMGKVGEKSIKEIWNDKPFQDFRARMMAKDFELPCLKCLGNRPVL